MSQISRRQAMAVLGALGLTATAAACAGPGGSTAPGGATGPSAPATGDITGKVSFAHWRGEDKAVFDELIKRFVAKNSGAEVVQDISTSNDYNAQGLQKVRGAAIGDAFATFRGAQFTNFSEAGIYTELKNSKAVGNYQKGLLSAGQSGENQLGLPYQVVFPMPMANTDLFDKAGADLAPKDWDAFLAMCEKLASSGVTPISWPGGDVGNGGQLFNCMIANNAPVDDMCAQIEQGKLKCTDDWFITMLNQYKDLVPFLQANATGTAVEPAQNLFSQGKAAMLATGPTTSPPSETWARRSPSNWSSPTLPRAATANTRASTTPPSSSASTRPASTRRQPQPGSISCPNPKTRPITPMRRPSTLPSRMLTTPTRT